jgi:hypothetical protein
LLDVFGVGGELSRLFYADVEVSILPGHEEHGRLVGAFVYCFVVARDEIHAFHRVRGALEEDFMGIRILESIEEYDLDDPRDWESPDVQQEYDGYALEATESGSVVYSMFYGYEREEE